MICDTYARNGLQSEFCPAEIDGNSCSSYTEAEWSTTQKLHAEVKALEAKLSEKRLEFLGLLNLLSKANAALDKYKEAEKFVDDPPHDQECCSCATNK